MMKIILVSTLFFCFSSNILASEYEYTEMPMEPKLNMEFKMPLKKYFDELSLSIGYYFTVNNKNCIDPRKISKLLGKRVGINTDSNASVYEHLSEIALLIGNDYNVNINQPLKSIEITCENPIKDTKND